MRFALTNYGLRRIVEIQGGTPLCCEDLCHAEVSALGRLKQEFVLDATGASTTILDRLKAQDLVFAVPQDTTTEEIARRHRQNPIENVKRVIFEYTSHCNFACEHCYNARVARTTETDPNALKRAAEVFLRMGIRRFDFIGGEVSKYGNGWLGVVRHLRGRDPDLTVPLYTNGWWLGRRDFVAAGERYADDRAYCDKLYRCGVTHVLFSLDDEGRAHDRSRGQDGLYNRIYAGLERVKESGLGPRVSLLWQGQSQSEFQAWMARIADKIYDFPVGTSSEDKAWALTLDETNKVNHYIDIGAGVGSTSAGLKLHDIAAHQLRCKAFFRPSPSLTIKASGELATCRVSRAGEGYGNIHSRTVTDILNHLQDAFVYKLHADNRIERYLPFVDPRVFGKRVFHPCSARVVVTLIACRMEREGIEAGDTEGILRVNREVAALTGHDSE